MTKKRSIIALTLAALLIAVIAIVGTMRHGDAATQTINIDLSEISSTSGGLVISGTSYSFNDTTTEYTSGSVKNVKFVITGKCTYGGVSSAIKIDSSVTSYVDIVLSGVTVNIGAVTPIVIAEGCTGDVNITIADGTTNTLYKSYTGVAISKSSGSVSATSVGTLTINGGAEGTGKLLVKGASYQPTSTAYVGGPAIGSETGNVDNIVINGGNITLTGGYNAPALGSETGTVSGIVINGGAVTATAGTNANAIGGASGSTVKDVTINGGTITLSAPTSGYYAIGGTTTNLIEINGGSVKTDNGMAITPRNVDGTYVYKKIFANPNGLPVLVNGKVWGVANHKALDSSDTNLYAWITSASTIALQSSTPSEINIDVSQGCLYIDEDTYTFGESTYSYVNGTPFVLSGYTEQHHVTVAKDVDANITLNGVDIKLSNVTSNPHAAILIEENSTGDVNLTLAEGTSNTFAGGYACAGIEKGCYTSSTWNSTTFGNLTIDGEGTLFAYGNSGSASIGGGSQNYDSSKIRSTSNIIINGGNIYLPSGSAGGTNTGAAETRGANIGSGIDGTAKYIYINGGTVTAYAPNTGSAAIGSAGSGNASNITINGGTVNAYGMAAGIGSGSSGTASYIYIKGGTVTAKGGTNAAGIGSGGTGNAAQIHIEGGTVTATGGANGAGIGSGSTSRAQYIYVREGATVTATGGTNGAGIGSGMTGQANYIGIYGGVIKATGGTNAAGIGSGGSGSVTRINITGGTITASGNAGTTSSNVDDIGNGYYNSTSSTSKEIFISGGSVKATSTGCTPVVSASDSSTVALKKLANPNSKPVFANGKWWEPVNHTALDSSDTYLYLWIPTTATAVLGPIDMPADSITAPTAITGLTYTGSSQTLVNAGSATYGTLVYKFSENGTEYASAKATAAGTKTVYWYVKSSDPTKYNDYYPDPAYISVTIAKANSSVTKAPTANTLTYNGKAQALVAAGTASGGTMKYWMNTDKNASFNISNATTTIPTATNAGTYYVWYCVIGDSNHGNTIGSSPITVTIAKAASSVTNAPTANTLTYNGKAQALVEAGTASGGTMQYAVTTTTTAPTTYSATIPTKTEPGTYYVWYKVVGDSNHTDLTPGKYVTAKIVKADPTVTLPTLKTGLEYTGSAQELITAGSVSTGSGHFEYSLDGSTWITSIPSGTAAGTYTIYYKVTSTTQYNGISSTKLGTVTIAKVASSVTKAPTANTLTYNGSAQKLVAAGTASGGTMQYAVTTTTTAPTSYSATIPTKTNAGTYYVWYKVAGDSNHTDYTPGKYVKVTIAKSTPPAPTGLTANAETVYGKADGTITGLTTSMQVSTDNGTTWTDVTDPAMKFAAGSVKVRTKATSNTNASAAATLTIASGAYLKVTVTPLTGVTATSTSDLTKIPYNGSVTLTVKLSTGFSKTEDFAVYVNGKAVTVNSSNQFTISNMTADATVSFAGVKDLNPPVIDGVENGETYYVSQKVTVTDDNLTSVTVNGTDYTSKIPFTLAGDKTATYTIIAKDAGGNTVTYTVKTLPIETVAEPIDGMTVDNVTEKDIPTIQGVLEEALGIDTDDATDAEKAEVQAIIDKCIELLAAIPGGMVFDMSKGSLVIYEDYFTFGDHKANYEPGMEFILTGSTDKYTVTVKKDVEANITLKNVSITLPVNPVSGASGVDNEGCALLIETDSTADVTITIADDSVNTLQSSYSYAGIQKNVTSQADAANHGTLTIQGDVKKNGQLNAYGRGGSGIGSGKGDTTNGYDTTNIVINSGVINAKAISNNGAGIGGYNQVRNLTINGGTITATGGNYAAGIGGGGNAYNITINDGKIVANGGNNNNAVAIGGYGVDGIYINGGNITAISTAPNSAGIGSESTGVCKNIKISGGAIYAQGGANAPGIGSVTGKVAAMNITGGTITAKAGVAQFDSTYIIDDIGYGVSEDGATVGTLNAYNSVIFSGGSIKANVSIVQPVDGSYVNIYLNEIKNPDGKNVYANGKWWSPVNHTALDSSDTTLYAWLPKDATYQLAPIDPTVTAPTAKTLDYTGNAQALVTAGKTSGGTIMYKLDDGEWSDKIPTATDAGNYTVYWYVDNGGVEDYYNATTPAAIEVAIDVAEPDKAPVVTFNDETIAGKEDGTIDGLGTNMEYSLDGGKTWIPVTDPDMTFAPGEVSVRYAATDNTTASPATTGTIGTGKYLTFDTEEVENATIVSDDDLDKIIYGDDVTFQVEIPTGFTKTDDFKVMVDGKTVTPDEDGNYTVSDITADKNITVVGVKDLNPPKIEGVTDGETYYVSQDVTVTDDNVKSVTVNGVPYTGEFPLTLEGDVDTTYEIVAEDEGGNITTVTITMKPIETIAEPIDGLTPENVTEDDRETIEDVLEKAESIDTTDATDEEKEEIQDIIDRCNELLDALDKYQTSTSIYCKAAYQAYLIEPWAMRVTVRFTDENGTTIDVATLKDYGVYAIRAGQLDALKNGEITIQDIINDSDAHFFGKSDVEGQGMWATGDGRAIFGFDDGLFTYRLSEEVYWLAYCEDANGKVHYMDYKSKSLHAIAETLVAASSTDAYIKAILEDMLVMEEAIVDYRSDFENLTDLEPSNPNTVGNCGIDFGPAATDGKYAIGNSYRVSLIEPWSIRLIARIYDTTDEDTSSTDHIDYSMADDYGVIVFQDIDGTHGNMTSYEDLLALENAYVYSKSQGNMEIDPNESNKVSAGYDKDIFTYQLDKTVYCVSFVEIDGQFYYSKLLTRNMHTFMTDSLANNSGTEKLLKVYDAMIEMYESVQNYHESL